MEVPREAIILKIGQFELDIFVHGHRVDEFVHEGETYIEGRNKSEYKLRFRNNTSQRVLAIVSVDGLSVMDGKEARLNSGGYVVGPRDFIDIPGWRLNDSEVAKFIFGRHSDSYAAKMDKPTNIGVIGCVVFEEKVAPPTHFLMNESDTFPFPPRHRPLHGGLRFDDDLSRVLIGSSSRSFGASLPKTRRVKVDTPDPVNPSGVQNLGTEFGEKEEHKVVSVSFDAKDTHAALFSITYDTRTGLENRGVQVRQPTKVVLNPFPGEGCTPPPGWRR